MNDAKYTIDKTSKDNAYLKSRRDELNEIIKDLQIYKSLSLNLHKEISNKLSGGKLEKVNEDKHFFDYGLNLFKDNGNDDVEEWDDDF